MPDGSFKNLVYHCRLSLYGKKSEWSPQGDGQRLQLEKLLHHRHAIGAAVCHFAKGKEAESVFVGFGPEGRPITARTLFRSASLAKPVTALLIMRLQKLGLLDTSEDISDFWGSSIRNPLFPEIPIRLSMLMSHTSSMTESPLYYTAMREPVPLSALLKEPGSFLPKKPGESFCYSNLAAGMIGCLLEKRFGTGIEALAQKYLFEPLHTQASYDLAALSPEQLSDCWRVLPPEKAFCARERISAAASMRVPDPEHHYFSCCGALYLTAQALEELTLLAWNGGNGFLDARCMAQLHTPIASWGDKEFHLQHCMGLIYLSSKKLAPIPFWGHQGFAYGSVNGMFFNEKGNGFIMLSSGMSEEREGRLARVNLDLIRQFMKGES